MIVEDVVRPENAESGVVSKTTANMLEGLLAPSVSALLIKGTPGAGKSTLALELMRMSAKGTYIMTRLSKERLAIQNPNIKMVLSGDESPGLSVDGRKLDAADDRLAGPKEVFKLVLERMMNEHGGLIILDSWDSIAKEMPPLERLRAEKTMVTMIQSSDSKLVFVSEEPDLTTTDYLVDAIVELKVALYRSRLRRTCVISKLRGQAIATPVSPYSLTDGRFEIFPPFHALPPVTYRPSKFVPIPHPPGMYSSGVHDIDMVMGGGGFFPGVTMTIEYGKGVSAYDLDPFMQTIMANFLANGGSTVVLPPSGESPDVILDPLRTILGKEVVDARARIGFYEKYEDVCTFQVHSRSLEETMGKFWELVTKIRGGTRNPAFLVVGIEKLEYVHGGLSVLRDVIPSVSRARYYKDALILVTSSSCETRDRIVSISDFHVSIEMWEGALTLQLLKPAGPLMVVKYNYSKGFPAITLTSVG